MTVLQKIANVTLAILLLGGTLGITLHKHHCMGHVRNVALMHQASNCQGEGEMEMPADCCKDTVEEFKVEDLNKTSFNLDVTPDLYVISAMGELIADHALQQIFSEHTAFLNYKPPLIERDVQVDVQSFLL